MESSFNHPAHQGLSSMHSPFSPYSSAYKPSSTQSFKEFINSAFGKKGNSPPVSLPLSVLPGLLRSLQDKFSSFYIKNEDISQIQNISLSFPTMEITLEEFYSLLRNVDNWISKRYSNSSSKDKSVLHNICSSPHRTQHPFSLGIVTPTSSLPTVPTADTDDELSFKTPKFDKKDLSTLLGDSSKFSKDALLDKLIQKAAHEKLSLLQRIDRLEEKYTENIKGQESIILDLKKSNDLIMDELKTSKALYDNQLSLSKRLEETLHTLKYHPSMESNGVPSTKPDSTFLKEEAEPGQSEQSNLQNVEIDIFPRNAQEAHTATTNMQTKTKNAPDCKENEPSLNMLSDSEPILSDTPKRMARTEDDMLPFVKPILDFHQYSPNGMQEGYESDNSSILEGEGEKIVVMETLYMTSPIRMSDLDACQDLPKTSALDASHIDESPFIQKNGEPATLDFQKTAKEDAIFSPEAELTKQSDHLLSSDSSYPESSSISCPEDSLDECKILSPPFVCTETPPTIVDEHENAAAGQREASIEKEASIQNEDTDLSKIFDGNTDAGILNADDYKSFFAKLAEWEEKHRETNEEILSSVRNKRFSPRTSKLYSVDSIMTPVAPKQEILTETTPIEKDTTSLFVANGEQLVLFSSLATKGPDAIMPISEQEQSYVEKLYSVGARIKSLSLSAPERKVMMHELVSNESEALAANDGRKQDDTSSTLTFLRIFLVWLNGISSSQSQSHIDKGITYWAFPSKKPHWPLSHQMFGFFLRRLYSPLGNSFLSPSEHDGPCMMHNGPLFNAFQLLQDKVELEHKVTTCSRNSHVATDCHGTTEALSSSSCVVENPYFEGDEEVIGRPNIVAPPKQEKKSSINSELSISHVTISSLILVVILYFIAVEQAKLGMDIPPV
ncbi:hypothetical protein MDAP_002271 [Mitosporidium daphniae]